MNSKICIINVPIYQSQIFSSPDFQSLNSVELDSFKEVILIGSFLFDEVVASSIVYLQPKWPINYFLNGWLVFVLA